LAVLDQDEQFSLQEPLGELAGVDQALNLGGRQERYGQELCIAT